MKKILLLLLLLPTLSVFAQTGPGSGTATTPTSPTLSFVGSSRTVLEGSGVVSLTIAISNPTSQTPASLSASSVQVVISSGSAQNGAEYSFADSQTITFPANSTASQTVSLTINEDSLPEADEYIMFRLQRAVNAQVGTTNSFLLFIVDNDKATPVSSDPCFNLQLLTTYRNPSAGGSSEIVAYDKTSRRMFIANSVTNRLEIVNMANPSAPVAVSSVSLSALGSINSVAVQNGLVAVALENSNKVLNGSVAFFDASGQQLSRVTAGALPDAVFFSPDGRYVVTPNEGEPDSYSTGGTDPEGSVTIIDFGIAGASVSAAAGLSQTAVTTVSFTALNGQRAALRSQGVRLYGRSGNVANGSTVSQDLEPEYIAFSPDSRSIYVTLQENNALAVIDLATKSLAANPIRPLGYKNHNTDANAFDPTDQGGLPLLQKLPVLGMYQPDAIASFAANGQAYYVTANEGDAREYDGLVEIVRAGDASYVLDPTVFPNAADLKTNLLMGRLNVTNQTGDTDGDGDFDQVYVLGGRSFSIWDAAGALVFDSGDDLERITRTQFPALFNASNTTGNPVVKNRSDDKGPEPEGVTTSVINGKPYAFIALERIGGVMVYDVSNPMAPRFVTYTVNRTFPTATATTDDNGPEGIIFIPAADSPNGQNLLLLANEISNSVSIYQVNAASPLQIARVSSATAGSTTLTASGCPTTVRWSTGVTGNSITVGAVTATTVITATCSTTAAACVGTASVTLTGTTTPVMPQPLSATVLSYNCATGDITFGRIGGDPARPVEYQASDVINGEYGTSTMRRIDPGARLNPAKSMILITIRYVGDPDSFSFYTFNYRTSCGGAREGVESDEPLSVRAMSNPVAGDEATVEVQGAAGQALGLRVLNGQGQVLNQRTISQAGVVERQSLKLGQQAGLYFIQASVADKTKTILVIRE